MIVHLRPKSSVIQLEVLAMDADNWLWLVQSLIESCLSKIMRALLTWCWLCCEIKVTVAIIIISITKIPITEMTFSKNHIREGTHFTTKSIRRRIYSCDGLCKKLLFYYIFEKWIFGPNSLELVITCQNSYFTTSKT